MPGVKWQDGWKHRGLLQRFVKRNGKDGGRASLWSEKDEMMTAKARCDKARPVCLSGVKS